jgi:hypothetical protein
MQLLVPVEFGSNAGFEAVRQICSYEFSARKLGQHTARSQSASTFRSTQRCRLDGFGARSQNSGSRFRDLCIERNLLRRGDRCSLCDLVKGALSMSRAGSCPWGQKSRMNTLADEYRYCAVI